MQEEKIVNGVNVTDLYNTIDAVNEQSEIAKFQFKASNRWINGANNKTSVDEFYGACENHSREAPFTFEKDEPPVLLGSDKGANPVEYLFAALAGCLTTSLVYHAAARGIELDEIESTYEGDIDLRGFLGLDETVRNGYQGITVTFSIRSDAPREQLEELVELAQQRSPVFDCVANPVPVSAKLA
ncbi:MAG: OsmC family peroxiredoxin [Acidobacteria bacterium]|nr:MAG: OsmC family peroxiredoxin [Acidobacteriota bacterium]REK02811.1 MAG: OsmC family peroxiredoxin [Acidobacteriota bacterium]REK13385.1 MAG: OsmC family peroxiredoxin [Acidobacteriota bacterium]REK41379.1 MAG: OsmC family peroxiredoxin [Acidobacteriota bacterium]